MHETASKKSLTTGRHASRDVWCWGGEHELSRRAPRTFHHFCTEPTNIRDLPLHHPRRHSPRTCRPAVRFSRSASDGHCVFSSEGTRKRPTLSGRFVFIRHLGRSRTLRRRHSLALGTDDQHSIRTPFARDTLLTVTAHRLESRTGPWLGEHWHECGELRAGRWSGGRRLG